MARTIRLAAICLAVFGPALSAGSDADPPNTTRSLIPNVHAARRNAFDIFNAIHSATRQWGSSLRHNGMSVFRATVPAGVLLHHGTYSPDPPEGPEWLAFEVEHAELFAHPRPKWKPKGEGFSGDGGVVFSETNEQRPLNGMRDHPSPLPPPPNGPPPDDETEISEEDEPVAAGYLHTYRTTAPLSLLYIDGMSAGKTDMGTLDTQDLLLLLNRTASPWGEWDRARDSCKLVSSWGLHGVIRMEAGFEIIKCDPFLENLELVSVVQRASRGRDDGPTPPWEPPQLNVRMFETIRAVARRYWGIGAGRIEIDWGSMVSAYFYDVDLGLKMVSFREDFEQPRLVGLSERELKAIRQRVEEVVREREGKTSAIDWQGVVDLVVARYAERLRYMAEGIDTIEGLRDEIRGLLDTHIDYATDDYGYRDALDRCWTFYIRHLKPETQEDRFILAAIETVTQRICSRLFKVRRLLVGGYLDNDEAVAFAKGFLRGLMKELSWTTWLECRGCGIGEVCFVPMWPWGDKHSHEQPNCRNATTLQAGWIEDAYWTPRKPGMPSKDPALWVFRG